MTGPVGGAGELTARILALKDNVNFRFGRSVEIANGITLGELFDAFVTLAEKAPQGALAKEVREALEICAVRSGNEGYWCLLCGASIKWPSEKQQMIHCQDCLLAAPPTPSKLPAPVSDDTIHHGMVPPLAVSKLADEVNQCLQIILTNAGNIKDDRDGPILEECIAIEDAVDRASKATWAALREAAAPKPAPPSDEQVRKEFYDREYRAQEMATPAPLTPDADAIEAPSTEDAPLLQMKPVRRSLAEKAKDEMSEFEKGFPYDGATPAPGAEMSDIKALAKSLSKFVKENGYGGDGEWVAYLEEYQAENWLREALAAATPAPAVALNKTLRELIEHWRSAGSTESGTATYYEGWQNGHANASHRCARQLEQELKSTEKAIRCGMCGDTGLQNGKPCPQLGCAAGDRHASAERVLRVTAKWDQVADAIDDGTGTTPNAIRASQYRVCAKQIDEALTRALMLREAEAERGSTGEKP